MITIENPEYTITFNFVEGIEKIGYAYHNYDVSENQFEEWEDDSADVNNIPTVEYYDDEKPIFYYLCELLSVDYLELSSRIVRITSRGVFDIKQIYDELHSHSVLLATASIATSIKYYALSISSHSDSDAVVLVYSIFRELALLKAYLEESRVCPELCNPGMFKTYLEVSFNLLPYENDYEIIGEVDFFDLPGINGTDNKQIIDMFFKSFRDSANEFTFEVNALFAYCANALYHVYKRGHCFNKCENCGAYFIPFNRSDTRYCDRVSPQDSKKTCKEYGKYINFLTKTQNDLATKLYRQIYNNMANKVRRTSNAKLQLELNSFMVQSAKWKADIKAGIKTEHEFIEWLQSEKGKRVL